MVANELQRKMCLVLGFVLIIAVCRCQISYDPFKRYESIMEHKRAAYSENLRASEIREFMQLWPKYKELGFDRDFYVPYLIVLPDSALNWKQRLWFRYNYWDANRFFYVQQRIAYLLQVLQIRRDAKMTMDLCAGMDDEISEKMIALQQRRLDAINASSTELFFVSCKEKELRELFK